jgi:hypothetical protein
MRNEDVLHRVKEERVSYVQQKGELIALVTS